jgi:DNA-binding transcriptional MerR regulator
MEGECGMSVTVEEQRVRTLFEAVENAEDVAREFPEGDERRTKLLDVSSAVLAEVGTVRPVIAAKLLGLDEKTIRAWAEQGVLVIAQRTPRLLLDASSVHEIHHMIRQLREAGKHRGLLEEIWRRLNDQALIESDDFQESLAQMRRGEYEVLRPLPEAKTNGR